MTIYIVYHRLAILGYIHRNKMLFLRKTCVIQFWIGSEFEWAYRIFEQLAWQSKYGNKTTRFCCIIWL